jgi:hypothetical protein
MSEDLLNIINSSFDNVNIWIFTQDYIYGMIPVDEIGSRWLEVSYTFGEDEPLLKTERGADLSLQFLLEEVSKGVSFYVEDLKVAKLKDFVKSIEKKPSNEKIKALIDELVNNTSNYSADLSIIKNKDDLEKIKDKL